MRKLIFILSLFLSVTVSGQLSMAGLGSVASSGGLYGPEIMTNGGFNSDMTSWSGTNWAWQTDGSGGGWSRHTAGATGSLFQDPSAVPTSTYHTVYTIGGMTAGEIRIRVGNSAGGYGTLRSANGTYIEDIVCTGNSIVYLTPSSDFDGYIDNVSVKIVL